MKSKRLWLAALMGIGLMTTFAHAADIGLWRMEEAGKNNGDLIVSVANSSGNAALVATPFVGGTPTILAPVYSNDIPGTLIKDPITNNVFTNTKSMLINDRNGQTVTNYNSNLQVADFLNLLDRNSGSFTFEAFVKMTNAAGGNVTATFHSVLFSRQNTFDGTDMWQSKLGINDSRGIGRADVGGTYGQDTPVTNQVALGDTQWHHIAFVYDAPTQTIKFYSDYTHLDTRVISAPLSNTGTGPLKFGRPSSNATDTVNNWYMDEARYSTGALTPSQFLVVIPEPATLGLMALGGMMIATRRHK